MTQREMKYHAIWCMSDGVTHIVTFDEWDDAYEYYATNPFAYSEEELTQAKFRGVFDTFDLTSNILREFI